MLRWCSIQRSNESYSGMTQQGLSGYVDIFGSREQKKNLHVWQSSDKSMLGAHFSRMSSRRPSTFACWLELAWGTCGSKGRRNTPLEPILRRPAGAPLKSGLRQTVIGVIGQLPNLVVIVERIGLSRSSWDELSLSTLLHRLTADPDAMRVADAGPDTLAHSNWKFPALEFLINQPQSDDELLTIEIHWFFRRDQVVDLLQY